MPRVNEGHAGNSGGQLNAAHRHVRPSEAWAKLILGTPHARLPLIRSLGMVQPPTIS